MKGIKEKRLPSISISKKGSRLIRLRFTHEKEQHELTFSLNVENEVKFTFLK